MLEAKEKEEIKLLSIERCRELLGDDASTLSDHQIGGLRDALYALGNTVLDNLFNPSTVSTDHE